MSPSALILLLIPAFGAPAAAPGSPSITVKSLAPGITYTQEIDQSPPLIINVLTVYLKAKGVYLGVGIGNDSVAGPGDGREDVDRAARRHGAIGAVNADLFNIPAGDPLGLGIQDGQLFSEPWTGYGKPGPRTALGVLPDGAVIIDRVGFLGEFQAADASRIPITGIDRPVGLNDVVVFTSIFGPATAGHLGGCQVIIRGVNLPVRINKTMSGLVQQILPGNAGPQAIPADGVVLAASPGGSSDYLTSHLHVGDHVGFVLGVAPPGHEPAAVAMASLPRDDHDLPSRSGVDLDRPAYFWSYVVNAVSGGPRLLVGGQAVQDGPVEGFGPAITDAPYPRTAAGVSADGKRLIIVTVDGRQDISGGVTLAEMSDILLRYGASDALNFDGGGSTAMSIAGVQVNSPGGTGWERPVADMLLVYSDHPYVPIPAPLVPVASGQAPLAVPLPVASGQVPLAAPLVPVASGQAPLAVPSGGGGTSGGVATPPAPSPSAPGTNAPPEAPGIGNAPSPPARNSADGPAQISISAGGNPPATASGSSAANATSGPITAHVDKNGNVDLSNAPIAPAPQPPASMTYIAGPTGAIDVGSITPLRFIDGKSLPQQSSDVIWQGKVGAGIGFVNQRGELTAIAPGTGSVVALYKGQLYSAPVVIVGATPTGPGQMTAQLVAAPGSEQSLLTVRVYSASGGPVSGAGVSITCTGGKSANTTLTTNPDGFATTNIMWSNPAGGSITAASGALSPVTVSRP